MASSNYSDFKEIVRDIDDRKILLPDFQRDFVWKDEERQKKIVASLLTKMPIGSILLLTSSADEYCSKVIGRNADLDTSDITGDVDFLLDGQQRITVLTNVFSNVIHDKCPKVSELVSQSLKRRFFLRIPKWIDVYTGKEMDLFGIKTLAFPLANPDADIPEFLSGDILQFVETQTFNANDTKPYNPHNAMSTDLDKYCASYPDGYLIPLYLLIQTGKKKNQMVLRFKDIMASISLEIKKEIYDYFTALSTDTEKKDFIKKIMHDEPEECAKLLDSVVYESEFEIVLDNRKDVWVDAMKLYLDSCVKTVYLSQIRVSASQRGRAIDIYENLNMGGVSLNTFDLIMARVAKVDKKISYNESRSVLKVQKHIQILFSIPILKLY